MKNTSKQSEGSDISSRPNEFKLAVFRLTAYYSAGVFLVLVIFSFLVYGLFAQSINVDLHDDEDRGGQEEVFHIEIKENLSDILITSDLILFFVTVLVSYVLSKKTLAPLELAYQKQKRFVADAAHELRTPLAVMKAGAEVLSRKERTVLEYQKFLAESLEEIERLIKLSNDLLFLARSDKVVIGAHELVSMSDLCHAQIDSIAPYAKLQQVVISKEIGENIAVFGKKSDLSRLILNIIKNAIDYNKPDGLVNVVLIKKNTKAILRVQDTGIGIAAKDLPNVFDRFFKADSSRSVSPGTGLGLAIARAIAADHQGSIHVQSILGQGSTFELELPCA
jgi:signal transduction histidine kinase